MGKTRHEKSFVDFDKPYEQNIIGLKGIAYFAIGLFLLVVITFGLMWALQNVMEDDARASKDSSYELRLSDKERLPPEPRLQAAPGFGVDSPNGRVNLELQPPQAEWWTIEKQYKEMWEKGQRSVDATGRETVVTLPINDAKERYLQQAGAASAPATGGTPPTGDALTNSRMIVSDSSAGRIASEKIR